MPVNKGYMTAKTTVESDEYYTPAHAITPLLEFVDKSGTIWCPFDTKNSQYVKIFQENGNKVIHSHIDEGKNFFYYEPEEDYDIIISNPPFSLKDDVLKRLRELGKPFAILLPLPSLQGQKRFESLAGGQNCESCEALIFDKRINFYQDEEQTKMSKGVAFASIYICYNFLPEKLVFRNLSV